MSGAGFPVAVSDDILRDMWSKWAFIAAAGAVASHYLAVGTPRSRRRLR